MRKQRVRLSYIHIAPGRRALNEKTVDGLVSSIKEIGLQNPISIYFADGVEIDGDLLDGVSVLVAGHHRLEALKRAGEEYTECTVFPDRISARKWEISENLHRADLTKLERDEQAAEWIRLTEEQNRAAQNTLTTCEDIPRRRGQPEGGIEAAARELGINRMAAHRAVKVASLPEPVKQAARDLGLDDNGSALLEAVKAVSDTGGDSCAGIAVLQERAESRTKPKCEDGRKAVQRQKFWKFWASLDDDVREELHAKLRTM